MTSSKVQRWTDLLVGLLRHRLGATFTELADEVPAYALPRGQRNARRHPSSACSNATRRLLAFGIPIETIGREDEIEKYRLRPADFYLPYLSILEHSGNQVAAPRGPRPAFARHWAERSSAQLGRR